MLNLLADMNDSTIYGSSKRVKLSSAVFNLQPQFNTIIPGYMIGVPVNSLTTLLRPISDQRCSGAKISFNHVEQFLRAIKATASSRLTIQTL